MTPWGKAQALPGRGCDRWRSAILASLLAVLTGGCAPATSPPSTELASSGPSAQPSWPSKAPQGATPGRVAAGSLLPGEDNLALEAFDDPSVFSGPDRVMLRQAVAVGSGFVVLGDTWHAVGATTAHAWSSPDGRSWQRLDAPSMDNAFVINDLAATVDGTLLAIGIRDAASGSVVWSSSDGGRAWQTTPIEDAPAGMQLVRVVAGPKGVVMMGSVGATPARAGDTTLWWSADGLHWTRAEMPRAVFGDVTIGDISATAAGFVAVGARWPAGEMPLADSLERARGAAWFSADGLTWVDAAVTDAPVLGGLVLGERLMLARGSRWTSEETSWWRSDDGRAWEPDRGWHDLWAPTASWTIFGWQGSFYQLGTNWSSGGPVLELWMSEDGDAWRRVGATLERRTGGLNAEAVPGAPGILTLGERDGAGVLWLIPWPMP